MRKYSPTLMNDDSADIREYSYVKIGTLAQLAEHRPFKANVVGSSPTRLTCLARSSIG